MEGTREASAGCKHLGRKRSYQFGRHLSEPLCVMCAILYRPMLRRAIFVALVIGTILTLINQGDVLLMGAVTPLVLLKILLTYMVPYGVSTYSALLVNRIERVN